jgi:hypothetical protein
VQQQPVLYSAAGVVAAALAATTQLVLCQHCTAAALASCHQQGGLQMAQVHPGRTAQALTGCDRECLLFQPMQLSKPFTHCRHATAHYARSGI